MSRWLSWYPIQLNESWTFSLVYQRNRDHVVPWFPSGCCSSLGILASHPGPGPPRCPRCRPESCLPAGSSSLLMISIIWKKKKGEIAAALQSLTPVRTVSIALEVTPEKKKNRKKTEERKRKVLSSIKKNVNVWQELAHGLLVGVTFYGVWSGFLWNARVCSGAVRKSSRRLQVHAVRWGARVAVPTVWGAESFKRGITGKEESYHAVRAAKV